MSYSTSLFHNVMDHENPIYDIKLSSVAPGTVTGPGIVHEPTNMDLVMKLHYLRGLYFFKEKAVKGLTILNIKESMIRWLDLYYINCGRFQRSSETGRPYIKCHDCGIRIIEAKCKFGIDEWLEMKDHHHQLNKLLVSNQVLGPELAFSPLILIQLTWFKCGGMSVGLSWAHVLGDAFSASDFINMWGHDMMGHPISISPSKPQLHTRTLKEPTTLEYEPLSTKWVDPVGDYWNITANNCKLGTYSFQITAAQLKDIQSKIIGHGHGQGQSQDRRVPSFEPLSALIWHSLAKARNDYSEPRIITICRRNSSYKINGYSGNNQIVSTVKANFSILKSNVTKLAELLIDIDRRVPENSHIEQIMERDEWASDFIMYGVNLTFVDLEDADVYGLVLKDEHKPVFVNYTVDGVGDEGVVLVLPGPTDGGRTVTVIVPDDQVLQLRNELKREWDIE